MNSCLNAANLLNRNKCWSADLLLNNRFHSVEQSTENLLMVLQSSLGINIHSRNQSRVNGILAANHLVLADSLFTAKDNHCLISLVTTGI